MFCARNCLSTSQIYCVYLGSGSSEGISGEVRQIQRNSEGIPWEACWRRSLGGMVLTCVPLPCAYPTSWHNSHTPSNTSWCHFLQEAFPDLSLDSRASSLCGVLCSALALLPVRCLYLHFSWGLGSFRVEASPDLTQCQAHQYMPHTLVM